MREGSWEVAVIGGGLVGAAIGYGMARARRRVIVLDEGDRAFRASRGNFALVWVQGKGVGMPGYAAWTRHSSEIWAGFAREVGEETGISVAHRRPGGFALALSEAELERRGAMMARLMSQEGMEPYEYERVGRNELFRRLPEIGPEVVGAIYCPLDGDVNSLRLFRALHTGFVGRGGAYAPGRRVRRIAPVAGGGFEVVAGDETVAAERVVLAAGIGNARLAPMVGLSAAVRPQRGQVIVTEKAAPFLPYPMHTVRQTDEGGVMIGDSAEEIGAEEIGAGEIGAGEAGAEDGRVGLGILAVEAERAARMFPRIGRLNVVRTWSALRVMTADGFPIYEQSEDFPGAFLCTCHSGVTLAAAHALTLAPMIDRGALEARLSPFSARRFDVPAVA
ncbi:MAG TPA: FAD-dependent oxidoreductase [Acetobacteraceae bacterium]|nr:FAD-dependent oxidoreductase [Acetobacteraceae bacterium]